MGNHPIIKDFAKLLKNDPAIFRKTQSGIMQEFKQELQRFRRIKESTELTVVDLDTISQTAAKNFLNSLMVNEFPVSFQIVK